MAEVTRTEYGPYNPPPEITDAPAETPVVGNELPEQQKPVRKTTPKKK